MWIINPNRSTDGYDHHVCSRCKNDAIFQYITTPQYDEGMDGEWHYLGNEDVGILEHQTRYCPYCGLDMEADSNACKT